MIEQAEALEISDRLDKHDVFEVILPVEPPGSRFVSRVHRINRRKFELLHGVENAEQIFVVIGILLAMASQVIISRGQSRLAAVEQRQANFARRQPIFVFQKSVVHGIADEVRVCREIFRNQIVQTDLSARQSERRNMIGANAIDLFRIGHDSPANSGFDVTDRNVQFRRRKCRRQCRIHIAVNENPIRLLLDKHVFHCHHHTRRHFCMTAAGNAEIYVRLRQLQFVEKLLRHVVIEMLPGMDEKLFVVFAKNIGDCRRFDELRATSDHG